MFNPSSLLAAACAWLFVWLVRSLIRSRRGNPGGLPYPPGPKGRLILGNAQDLPEKDPWLTYRQWGKHYNSDLVHACVLGQHIIVVNSLKAANDLFEKRSRIYADRPKMPMADLMGWEFNFALMPADEKWRQQRRFLHQNLTKKDVREYGPAQAAKIHDMLRGFLTGPEKFLSHIKMMTSGVVMSIFYGYDIDPAGDPFLTFSDIAVGNLANSAIPGAAAVNLFPILRYLPSWFPGAGFHQYAQESKAALAEMKEIPFRSVKEKMAAGIPRPSIVGKYLEQNPDANPEELMTVKDSSTIGHAAGADTTAASVTTFVLAMATHPAVQKRAQDELDAVIGTRLPTPEDRDQLPYVEAILREVFRWRPVAPLSLPHSTQIEDIYNGCYIPKGTTVFPNIWAMYHDESLYKDPKSFCPERFLDEQGELNGDQPIVFGFGRRICVGRHLADATVWLAIASILATFNVRMAKDSAGNDIAIPGDYVTSIISAPCPFQCSITPRSADAAKLVLAASTT